MAKKKPAPTQVESICDKDTRKNIPTEKLRDLVADDEHALNEPKKATSYFSPPNERKSVMSSFVCPLSAPCGNCYLGPFHRTFGHIGKIPRRAAERFSFSETSLE